MLIHFVHDDIPPGFASMVGISFAILVRSGLNAEGLPNAVAYSIRANYATFLQVPYGGGRGGTSLFLNDALEQFAQSGDYVGLRNNLGKMYSAALLLGDATGIGPCNFTDWSLIGDSADDVVDRESI